MNSFPGIKKINLIDTDLGCVNQLRSEQGMQLIAVLSTTVVYR